MTNQIQDNTYMYHMNENATSNIKNLLNLDANDESLRLYKERLLGDAIHGDIGDLADTRRVIIETFHVKFHNEKYAPINYNINTPHGLNMLQKIPFQIPEKALYKFVIKFKVNGKDIVTGLKVQNKVRRTVFTAKDDMFLGSYAPRSQVYDFEFPRKGWLEAPSGRFFRGKYSAEVIFYDDDEYEHLKAIYCFNIIKQ